MVEIETSGVQGLVVAVSANKQFWAKVQNFGLGSRGGYSRSNDDNDDSGSRGG